MTKCGYGGILWVNDTTHQTSPFRCNSGRCERRECKDMYCKKRLAIICNLVAEYNLQSFFTLTIDRSLTIEVAWSTIAHVWSKMRKRLNREAKRSEQEFRYVAVLEAHKDGYPHIHGFTNLYVWKEQWSYHWHESGGGKHGSNVKGVTDTLKAGEYVNKELAVGKYVGKDNMCKALEQTAPRKRTIWRSKGLKTARELVPKVQSDWRLSIGVKVNGKVYERKDLEAAQRALPKGSTVESECIMEAKAQTRVRQQEDQGLARQARQSERRDQETKELIAYCGLATEPEPSDTINNMIRSNIWLNAVKGRYQVTTHKGRVSSL